jgi:hypothetical protein
MAEALLRASLQTASHAEVKDPKGKLWTVHIIRRGDPRESLLRQSNLYFVAVLINRISRLVRRDHAWNVELMPGQLRDNRAESDIKSTEPDRNVAIDVAVNLAERVKAGSA